jgi:hypothetical protein
MEYASGGRPVDQLIQARVFTVEAEKFYAAEITLALEYLYKKWYLA